MFKGFLSNIFRKELGGFLFGTFITFCFFSANILTTYWTSASISTISSFSLGCTTLLAIFVSVQQIRNQISHAQDLHDDLIKRKNRAARALLSHLLSAITLKTQFAIRYHWSETSESPPDWDEFRRDVAQLREHLKNLAP